MNHDDVAPKGTPSRGDSGQEAASSPVLTEFLKQEPILPEPCPPPMSAGLLDALRVSQDFDALVEVEELPNNPPLCKPKGQWWIRVHRDWQRPMYLFKDGEDRDRLYAVVPSVVASIRADVKLYMLYFGVTTSGMFFFWPIRRPDATGRTDSWTQSAKVAAALAKDNWIRMFFDEGHPGAFRVVRAVADKGEPIWPLGATLIDDLLLKAVADNCIDTVDHAVVVRLLGK